MVAAIGGISTYGHYNAEYLRILQELRRLGISPSGNMEIDKGKLEQAKTELIEKIQHKQEENDKQAVGVQTIGVVNDVEENKRSEMEEQRLGAMNVAELNKIYFGLV